MQPNTPSISLTIELPDGNTKVLEFNTAEPIMVGSGSSVQVRLDDDDVSSLHCMIKPHSDGRVAVLDLGSDEGTRVNQKMVAGEAYLEDGDIVQVGAVRITVHYGGDLLTPTVPIQSPMFVHEDEDDRDATLDASAEEILEIKEPIKPTEKPVAVSKVVDAVAMDTTKPDLKLAKTDAKTDSKTDSKADTKSANTKTEKSTTPPSPAETKTAKPVSTPQPAASAEKPARADSKAAKSSSPVSTKAPQQAPHHVTEKPVTGSAHAHNTPKQLVDKPFNPAMRAHEKPSNKGTVDVSMLWGGTLIGVQRLSAVGQSITIGNAANNSFPVGHASIPSPSYPLVTMTANGASITTNNGMELFIGDKPVNASRHDLDVGQSATVRVGPVEFVVQYANRYKGIDLGLFQALDYFYIRVLALALIGQLGLITAIRLAPNLEGGEDEDLFKNQNQFTKLVLNAEEKKKEKPKEDLSGKQAAKHKDDEGKFGKKDKPQEDKAASKKGAPTVDKDKREEDRKLAMDALAALGLNGPQGAISNVLGPGGLGTGNNNALGGLKGTAMGDAGGAGGMGSRGTGAGGGGNSLGIGGVGSGTGRGGGGNGEVDLGGKGKGTTRIVPGKVTFEGSLSKEEIQRVINRVMSQIKHCYEKELNANPNLEGKLVASWTISGTGGVSSASMAQNTMGNDAVADCVTRIIRRLQFPEPKGGGQVFVTYPFVFSAGG